MHINKKRIIKLGVFFTLILILLIARLSFIQIVNGSKYKEISAKQQIISLSGIAIRGTIYDRNHIPLTNNRKVARCYIEKTKEDSQAKKLLNAVSAQKLDLENERYYIYECMEYNKEIIEQLRERYGAFIFMVYRRYGENQPASHLIGYINKIDNTGQSGLEKNFDYILNSSEQKLYAVTDGLSRIISGLGIIMNTDKKDGDIVTTLDYYIQTAAEKILSSYTDKGSLIVLEAKTGNILACVSLPDYNPDSVRIYLESNHGELLNKSIQSCYPPGSVFKIVVAAAALENQTVDLDARLFCKGYEDIGGTRIKCSSAPEGGHGEIDLIDAFAKSCNSAFIQIGRLTGASAIMEMAEKLGLGKKTMNILQEESEGKLPSEDSIKGAGIGNLSIGQGELLVTPIQAAKLTQIIANGGKDTGINLVSSAGTGEEKSNKFAPKEPVRVLSEDTCRKLNEMMKAVVNRGTADNMNLNAPWTAAGKTGSAQATSNGSKVVHGWFTGYVPADNPKYVITVFVEEGKSGRGAVPIFGKMAEWLYYYEKSNK